MKIKLAILDHDKNYLGRVAGAFGAYYADKLEVYSFTDAEAALSALAASGIHVFLAAHSDAPNPKRVPEGCAFAYLVDMPSVDTLDEQVAVCKFQSAEMLYKRVLDLFSRSAKNLVVNAGAGGASCLLVFSSPCGGVGTSAMAAGCAMYFATQGKKALYLDLEVCGSAQTIFHADGTLDFGDIIYAAKSKGANLALKTESCVRRDSSGVYFFAPAKIALDMRDLRAEEIRQILNTLQCSGGYDYIVADMDFSLRQEQAELMCSADHTVVVSDGSQRAAEKIRRALTALHLMDCGAELAADQICLFYNRLRKKQSAAQLDGTLLCGSLPELDTEHERDVAAYMAERGVFAPLTDARK